MVGRDMSISHIPHDLRQEQLMHRPGGGMRVDTCGTWMTSPHGHRHAGQGLEQRGRPVPLSVRLLGLLHISFPQGLVRAPHSQASQDPHMSPPGTKANCVLPLLTTSKSHRPSFLHSLDS